MTKVAVIAGAAGEITQAAAILPTQAGWELLITDIDDDAGTAVAHRLAPARYLHADVSSDQDWKNLHDTVALSFGRLDLLYFNARTSARTPLDGTSPASWRRLVDLHVTAAYRGVRTFADLLRSSGGSVVLTSSIHATPAFRHYSAYAAAKGGPEAPTRQLAVDRAPRARVNAISLGW